MMQIRDELKAAETALCEGVNALLALPPSCPSRSALCIIKESYGLTLPEAHFVALLAVLSESHAAPLVDLAAKDRSSRDSFISAMARLSPRELVELLSEQRRCSS